MGVVYCFLIVVRGAELMCYYWKSVWGVKLEGVLEKLYVPVCLRVCMCLYVFEILLVHL